jgi:hypothetical protein
MADNPVTFNEACQFFTRMGYTFEYEWRDSHGNGYARHYQAPGDRVQIMVVDWERNLCNPEDKGKLRVYEEHNPRGDYRAAREFDREADNVLLLSKSFSACSTSMTERFFKYGWIITISTVVGHGTWLNRDYIKGRISECDALSPEEKAKVIEYMRR